MLVFYIKIVLATTSTATNLTNINKSRSTQNVFNSIIMETFFGHSMKGKILTIPTILSKIVVDAVTVVLSTAGLYTLSTIETRVWLTHT